MSKTVRISDQLYQSIDEARGEDQTFEDFIEEMAKEYGLLPEGIQTLGALRKKLENVYGFAESEVQGVVSALKAIYTGQEESGTIGYPHAEAENRYGRDNIGILKRLGLVREHNYTGMYDFGYETTKVGEGVANEVVTDFIEEKREDIQETLSKYDDRMLSFLMQFGFERTDTGHLSTRHASLTLPSEEVFEYDEMQRRYDELKQDLVDLNIAERHSEGGLTILPPEFADFITGMGEDIRDIHQQIEVHKVIRDYVNDDIESRDEMLSRLDNTNESRLKEIIKEMNEDGLTSKYVQKEIPFLVKDQEALFDRLQTDLNEALKGTEALN